MSDDLYIWLPVDASLPWHWRHGDDAGMAVDGADRQSLGERGAKNIYAIIPGQYVRILELDLPKMRDSERLSAAGFSIEDKLATPLTDQHIVVGPSGDKRVGIISQAEMARFGQVFDEAGIRPSGLYADFDVLAEQTNPILLPDRCVFPGPYGYTLDREWADSEQDEQSPAAVSAQVNSETNISHALNLLTGRFAPRSRTVVNWKKFSRLAALLVMACLVGLVWQGTQNRAKLKQADYLRAETARMYSDFTGQAAPANPALSVTRAVKSSGKNTADFLALSSVLFKVIETVEGVTIETLQFDEAQNQLTLRLRYPSFESGTALEQAVGQLGGEFRAGGIREQSGRLIGDGVMILGAGS